MDEAEMQARFAASPVARLATADADGRPHLIPVCFALEGATIVSAVDRKPKRTTALRRLANIGVNPYVSLLVDEYHDDWTRLWWVRADGHAVVLDAGDERSSALARLGEKYPQYHADTPLGPVIAVAVERWRGWSWRDAG